MKKKISIIFGIIAAFLLAFYLGVINKELENKNTMEFNSSHNINDPNNIVPVVTNIDIERSNVTLELSNTNKICIKSTTTNPKIDNLCWHEVEDDKYSMSIFTNKKYYIWLMDEEENIYKANETIISK